MGLAYVFSMLSRKGWKYEVVKQGRAELHRIKGNNIERVIKIRTLSKEAPVPFPQGLDVLDQIHYLVICHSLKSQPKLVVLEPKTVKNYLQGLDK